MKHKLTIISEHVRARAISIIAALPLDPAHEVEIREKKSRRSLSQNALLWKWLDIIRVHVADSTGEIYSAEDLHEFFKSKFLPVHTVEIAGETVKARRTTTKLNTAEMAEYLDNIDKFCADRLHLWLPQPGDE